MHVVLYDTQHGGVTKDFAGGFGVGRFHGGRGIASALVRAAFARDRRPVALAYAYLAAIFRAAGHTVEYALDRLPRRADLHVFHPALMTISVERQAISQLTTINPGCRIWIVGPVAQHVPEAFAGLDVTLLPGEPEQLHWRLEEVLANGNRTFDLGQVAKLDDLPLPDWTPFAWRGFRVGYDFSQFPTAFVQHSRGCRLKCDYCPYLAGGRSMRYRSVEAVAEEIVAGTRLGFRSFKFRDPLFGFDRRQAFALAARLARLPRRVQFSIETRVDLLPDELLDALREAGLTSVTFGVETPADAKLVEHRRVPIRDDVQRGFIEKCRQLGIRTVAGFMLGFADDTPARLAAVVDYARRLNPTFANFNLVTPYPGTAYFDAAREQLAHFDYSQYDVYTPVLRYAQLSPKQLREAHAAAFVKFYFRSRWLSENAATLFPTLTRFGRRVRQAGTAGLSRPQPPEQDQQRHGADHHGEHRDATRRQHAA